MQLNVSCPHCGEKLSVASEYAGKTGKCKKCGNKFTVPIPEAKMEIPEAAMQSSSASGRPGAKSISSLGIGIACGAVALLCVVVFMALRGDQYRERDDLAAVPSLPSPATPAEVTSEPVADIAPAATQATPAAPPEAAIDYPKLLEEAEAAARDRRWAEALEKFERVRENEPDAIEPVHGLKFATVYAVTGDALGHEAHCRWLFDRFASPTETADAERTAKAYLLSPSANKPDLLHEAEKRARFAVRKVGDDGKAWIQVAQGMAAYRLGNFAQASRMLEPAKDLNNPLLRTLALSYDAMALLRQGDKAEAVKALKRAAGELPQLPRPGTELYDRQWHDVVIIEMMFKEADEIFGHVLQFPADRVVGTWGLRDTGTPGVGGWENRGELMGPVFVPRGKEFGITVRPQDGTDLSYLANLGPNDVQGLNFTGVPIADEDLRHIAHLTGLRGLGLGGSRVAGEGMIHLARLTNLEVLDLSGTRVSNESFRHLRDLKEIFFFLINGTNIGDEGLRNLGELPALNNIRIADSRVTPAGIQRYPSLVHVWLNHDQLTDPMIEALGKLPALKQVVILDMDDALAQRTRQRLPGLEVRAP